MNQVVIFGVEWRRGRIFLFWGRWSYFFGIERRKKLFKGGVQLDFRGRLVFLFIGVIVCTGRVRIGKWIKQMFVKFFVRFFVGVGDYRVRGVQVFIGRGRLLLGMGLVVRIQVCLWFLGYSFCVVVLFVVMLVRFFFRFRFSILVFRFLFLEVVFFEFFRVIFFKDVIMFL